MAITWLIQKDSEAAVALDAAGVTSCVLTLRANGVDQLDFTQGEDWLASPAWPFGSKVTLISRAGQTDTIRFVGTVESIPRQASGGGPQAIRYTALNAAHALMLCDYSQEWHYTNSSGVDSVITEPTVVLGEDNSGVRLASGGVIAHVAAYAVARGVPMAVGTVAAGVTVPLDERDNIRCWDAIVAMLRYTPDYVLWFDYSSGTPTLNVTAPASMSTLTRDVQDAAEAAFTPRLDLQVPGILCTFRWRGDYDGREVKYRDTQTAGNSTHPRRVSLVYDLDGVHAVFISQQVEVEDYPADWTSSAGKTALKARLPQLAQLADGDWSVVSVTRSGSLALPARLVSGAVPEWTDKDTETETFTAEIRYTAKSTDTSHVLDAGTKKLTFTCVSTDATSKTYRKMTEYVEPEPVPADMAASLYASWNRLHYDGRIEFRAQDCDLDLRPGALLSCTGGLAEWATMAAVIQDVAHDLATGTTVVTTGTCGRLEADNLMAVYRAARGRRFSYLRLGRDNPDAGDGAAVDGAGLTPNDGADGGAPPVLRTRLGVEAKDAGDRSHLVDIHPAAIAFADSAHAAAQTVQLREMLIPYLDSGAAKAKLAQVLCGASYGDEIPLGGRPADPASPASRGSTTEADLSSSAAFNPASPGGADGLTLIVSLGCYYDHTSGTPVLKDYRVALTWPNAIAPKVSAAYTVNIDTPDY